MTAEPTHEERIRTNYNRVGVAVMQAMYSDDYLSLGGKQSTTDLAVQAGIVESAHVLDIGCGVGGPMLHLADTIGCTVTGLDLVHSNIDQAQLRATERGLTQRTTFRQGDATALPFPDNSFDVVWGQDAWCHVPDKAALLNEAARVLRPGGTIAFTDWLAGDGMTASERHAALDAAVSASAASADEYSRLLVQSGYIHVRHTDIGPIFLARYREICARLQAAKSDLTERFGARVYGIVVEMNTTILTGFEGGAIGGGQYLARLPGAGLAVDA